MTARFEQLRARIALVMPLYRPVNWVFILGEGSALPTHTRLLPAFLRRFARRIRRQRRSEMRHRSLALRRARYFRT